MIMMIFRREEKIQKEQKRRRTLRAITTLGVEKAQTRTHASVCFNQTSLFFLRPFWFSFSSSFVLLLLTNGLTSARRRPGPHGARCSRQGRLSCVLPRDPTSCLGAPFSLFLLFLPLPSSTFAQLAVASAPLGAAREPRARAPGAAVSTGDAEARKLVRAAAAARCPARSQSACTVQNYQFFTDFGPGLTGPAARAC